MSVLSPINSSAPTLSVARLLRLQRTNQAQLRPIYDASLYIFNTLERLPSQSPTSLAFHAQKSENRTLLTNK